MDLSTFIQGLVMGFSIAAPVGPIGLLCIRRTLAGGRWAGLATGLGAATADAFYGSLAAFGLTAISVFLVDQQAWLRIFGGLFLVFLGLRTVFSRPAPETRISPGQGVWAAYNSAVLLTLSNPATILSFAAVFVGLGVAPGGGSVPRTVNLVAGVFLGSAFWWLVLSSTVGLLQARVSPAILTWVNRISGVILAGFGVAILMSVLAG